MFHDDLLSQHAPELFKCDNICGCSNTFHDHLDNRPSPKNNKLRCVFIVPGNRFAKVAANRIKIPRRNSETYLMSSIGRSCEELASDAAVTSNPGEGDPGQKDDRIAVYDWD